MQTAILFLEIESFKNHAPAINDKTASLIQQAVFFMGAKGKSN